MTTYAVGDIQGCLTPLKCLLDHVNFDTRHDTLWCCGDLINRGKESLATLRYLYSIRDNVRVVLGNHDLHFLAVRYGFAKPKRSDTIQEILDAPDCNELCDWLRHQPLLYHENGYTMVHAGIPPNWSLEFAQARAKEVEDALQGPDFHEYFANMYGNKPKKWKDSLEGYDRLRVITNYFTRMRFCTPKGKLDLENKLGPESAAAGTFPWFQIEERAMKNQPIIFGHWASLQGASETSHVYALDTGCVWGGTLTLMNLDTRELLQCECD